MAMSYFRLTSAHKVTVESRANCFDQRYLFYFKGKFVVKESNSKEFSAILWETIILLTCGQPKWQSNENVFMWPAHALLFIVNSPSFVCRCSISFMLTHLYVVKMETSWGTQSSSQRDRSYHTIHESRLGLREKKWVLCQCTEHVYLCWHETNH